MPFNGPESLLVALRISEDGWLDGKAGKNGLRRTVRGGGHAGQSPDVGQIGDLSCFRIDHGEAFRFQDGDQAAVGAIDGGGAWPDPNAA